MTTKSSRKPVPESDLPEVTIFLEAQAKIERFREAYPEVFEQYDQLAGDFNTALEAADKAVRGKGVSCGPFVELSSTTKYNADQLYEELGKEKFFEIGGSVSTRQVFEIDRGRIEAHIAAGGISKEVLERVRTITPRYKKPEKIVL